MYSYILVTRTDEPQNNRIIFDFEWREHPDNPNQCLISLTLEDNPLYGKLVDNDLVFGTFLLRIVEKTDIYYICERILEPETDS